MTAKTACLTPAFVLQQQHYRETSLLLQVLTRDEGRVAVLAKGVRKPKSKTAALLQPFLPLNIAYSGKTGLNILTHVEAVPPLLALQGLPLYCGFYLNELLCRFLYPHDPHPDVFAAYRQCLNSLAENKAIEAALRRFEIGLLGHVGYGIDFEHEAPGGLAVKPHTRYGFKAGVGLVADVNGPVSGLTLQALKAGDFSQPQVLVEAKLLMRVVIDSCLQGQPLKSRAVIQQIISSDVYG